MKYLSLTIFTLILCLPVFVQAETVLRISESVTIASDQTVEDDLYASTNFTGPVSISGTVRGDAAAVGSSVTTNGTIEADLLAIAGTANIHASVTDDVRVVAGEITVAEHIGGDLFVIGGVLKVLSTAKIDGNVYFYGGDGEINGTVGGSVLGTSERLRIDGPVAGDVDVVAIQQLTIGGRADIGGDIRFESQSELVRAQDSVVVGEVSKVSTTEQFNSNLRTSIIMALIYAITVFVVLLIFSRQVASITLPKGVQFAKDGLVGLATLFLTVPVVVALLVSLYGSIFGLLLFGAMIVMFVFAWLIMPITVGKWLSTSVFNTSSIFIATALGIATVLALSIIPIVGTAMLIALFSVNLGMLLRRTHQLLV